jgi:hypothetical protein
MSRWGNARHIKDKYRCGDGYYMNPKRGYHSFYTEFTTQETHAMFKRHGFEMIRSLRERSSDQIFLYGLDGDWPR